MNELQKILYENSKILNDEKFVQDIEIYIAKQNIFNIVKCTNECIKIFPKDGSHFIELSSNNYVEEKLFSVFQILYEKGLHHYISAMHLYSGTVSFKIKEMYKKDNIPDIFKENLGNIIQFTCDSLSYDFNEKYF